MKKLLSSLLILTVVMLLHPVPAFADSSVVLDSYASSNSDNDDAINGTNLPRAICQSWTTPNDGISYALASSTLYMAKNTSSTDGTAYAVLFSHSGVYGTSSVGGTSLATSTGIVVNTGIPTYVGPSGNYFNIYFVFDGTYTLSPNTHYVICAKIDNMTTGTMRVGTDTSSPTAGGNESTLSNTSTWTANSGTDMIFTVAGIAPAVAATPALSTTICIGGYCFLN